MMGLFKQSTESALVRELKVAYDVIERGGECHCDAGSPEDGPEYVHVCEKHEVLQLLRKLIYDNGGGVYGG